MAALSLLAKVEAATKYAFTTPAIAEGLLVRTTKIRTALVEIREGMLKTADLDEDEREKIESQMSLLERELKVNEAELARLKEILSQSPLDDEGGEETFDSNKEVDRDGEVGRNFPSSVEMIERPIKATSFIRQRTRPASEWTVSSDHQHPPPPPPAKGKPQGGEQQRRKEHDELTSELVVMARRLKQNNLAIQNLVTMEDRKALDNADLALTTNSDRFREQHRNLQSFNSKSWATTWRLLMIVVIVLISLVMSFMLIAVTKKG